MIGVIGAALAALLVTIGEPCAAAPEPTAVQKGREHEGPQKQTVHEVEVVHGAAAVRQHPPPAIAPFSEPQAKEHQRQWADYFHVPVVETNSIGMKLVFIPPGEFAMGTPDDLLENERRSTDSGYASRVASEAPQHRVRITGAYWLGMTDVTQEQYRAVMGVNPSRFKGDPSRPVECVSWDDAIEFCRRLSTLPGERGARRLYSPPTEAQWEFGCRAGRTTNFTWDNGQRRFEEAWLPGNSAKQTHAVGQKKPNDWGLYDMHGDVFQWCLDWYGDDYYSKSPAADPLGPPLGDDRVIRGGCWKLFAGHARSGFRGLAPEDTRHDDVGFRVLAVSPAMGKAALALYSRAIVESRKKRHPRETPHREPKKRPPEKKPSPPKKPAPPRSEARSASAA